MTGYAQIDAAEVQQTMASLLPAFHAEHAQHNGKSTSSHNLLA